MLYVYILSNDPKERCELTASVLSQAITALSFGHETELYLMDTGVKLAVRGYIDSLSCDAFAPLAELLSDFREMGGMVYVCHPSADARHLARSDFLDVVTDFVNASKLIGSSKEAKAVFTF